MSLSKVMVLKEKNNGFGSRLRELRESKKLSRQELSNLLGISYQKVTNWELELTSPIITELGEVADVLGVTIDNLLGVKSLFTNFNPTSKELTMDTLGSRIKVARLERQIKKSELAQGLNTAVSSITSWESDRKIPNIKNLIQLSMMLSVSTDFLLEGKLTNFNLPSHEELVATKSEFSKRLKQIRLERSLSRNGLASEIGLTPCVVYRWEKGTSVPSIDSLQKLLKFLGITFDEFLTPSCDSITESPKEVKALAMEIAKKKEDTRSETHLKTSDIIEDVIENVVEETKTLFHKAPESSDDLAQAIKRVVSRAQFALAEVMNQMTEDITSELSKNQSTSDSKIELNETELELIEKVRQLDESEIDSLQSYLNYLISKK